MAASVPQVPRRHLPEHLGKAPSRYTRFFQTTRWEARLIWRREHTTEARLHPSLAEPVPVLPIYPEFPLLILLDPEDMVLNPRPKQSRRRDRLIRHQGFYPLPSLSQPIKAERSGDGDVLMTPAPDVVSPSPHLKPRLDGVSALLRAGEIVEKRDDHSD